MKREMEYSAVSSCRFESGKIQADGEWHMAEDVAKDGDLSDNICLCTHGVPQQATIHIKPMERLGKRKMAHPKWRKDLHFHESLQLPTKYSVNPKQEDENVKAAGSSSSSGITVLLEGMARECLIVALSPSPSFAMGKTYEIIFGSAGNTLTILSRKSGASKSLEISVPARVCREKSWTAYWICLFQGKLYAGVGTTPGLRCVAILDDLARQDQPLDETDMPRYVGVGNCSSGDRQAPTPLRVRNLRVTTVPDQLASKLRSLDAIDLEVVLFLDQDNNDVDEKTLAAMNDYQDQCLKAKSRAQKFGVPYQGPPMPAVFLPWSEARRLQANPTKGFITGIDLVSDAEKAKQEARKARFGLKEDVAVEVSTGVPQTNGAEKGMPEYKNKSNEALPLVQAWDNEALVRKFRTDPPASLWKVPPPDNATANKLKNSFAMEEDEPELLPEKIHIFSIDWSAFKQIRNNDIMAYFSIYGPTYVEWLGDLSCNVQFEDKFSASRALHNLSQELPTPPPSEVVTAASEVANVQEGTQEQDFASILAKLERTAENASTQQQQQQRTTANTALPPPDFGCMGWRLGLKAIRKVADDRYGRRGTTARLIMRLATSKDVLHDRPNSWPKPPPGFSTKRVLGPGSDFPPWWKQRHEKNRKRNRRRDNSQNDSEKATKVGQEPSQLSGGLKCGRAGFSLEEMETERARKRMKVSKED